MEPLVPLQPALNFRMLVRGVVVDDQMQIQFRRRFRVDLLQELDPFLMPMPRHALGDDLAFSQFDGGEQRGRAVAFVVVRQRLQSAGEQRQALLRPVECLNLALFVAGKHQSVFRRIEVQADHIDQLLGELRIVRDFERLDAMRLQTVVAPDPLHRVFAHADGLGHAAHGPLCRVRWRFLSGLANDLCFLIWPGQWPCVRCEAHPVHACQPDLRKSIPPCADRSPRAAQFRSDVLVLLSGRRGQHDLRPLHQSCRRAAPARPFRQRDSFFVGQNNGFRNSHRHDPPCSENQTPANTISSRIYATLH